MYDTLHLWLPALNIGEGSFTERVPGLLSNTTLHTKADGLQYITGSVLGMSASVSNSGISLKGSLCKSYLNDNFKTLTRQDTQRAIEQMADVLILPVQQADVKRIDFAQSFTVNNKPESYYPFLGTSRHFKRLVQPKSVYYQNGMRTKLFYNKIAEGKSKGEKIPAIWANKHILRYELRYTSRLLKQFNKSTLQAKELSTEPFYLDMVSRWINEYKVIQKNSIINFNLESMKHPKDFFTQLVLLKINELGQNNVLELVEQLKAQNVFAHPEYYSRLKADIKKLCKTEDITESADLITELDKKINQVKEYCR